ncbi:MAG: hypothetical protein QXE03_04300 [Candidatus Nitrosocaldus sp.]
MIRDVMQSKALAMIAVLMLGGFAGVFADTDHNGYDHDVSPGDELGNICGTFNDVFISLDLHPSGGLPGDKTNATITADYNKSGGALSQNIFEFMYSYVTFAWYRPSTDSWIADATGGIWYNPADDSSLTPVTPRPTPNNALITTWSGGIGTRTVNQFPVPNITVDNLLPGEEIWLVACFAHPMPSGGSMDMNYTVAKYQVSICHTEVDREIEIIPSATQGLPGEPINVTVNVYLNEGDRPGGWRLIRLAWIDSTGNLVDSHQDVEATLVEGTVDPSTGRLTTAGKLQANATLTVPHLPAGTHLDILACSGHPMGQMYNGTNGYHSLDFTVLGFMVVPEVVIGSIGLIGAALGSFILYTRSISRRGVVEQQ